LAACQPVPSNPTTRIASGETVQACKAVGELAETVMTLRQRGVAQSELSGFINAQLTNDPQLRRLSTTIIQAAYAEPIRPTASGKTAVSRDFGQATVATCVNTLAT